MKREPKYHVGIVTFVKLFYTESAVSHTVIQVEKKIQEPSFCVSRATISEIQKLMAHPIYNVNINIKLKIFSKSFFPKAYESTFSMREIGCWQKKKRYYILRKQTLWVNTLYI